VLKRAALQRMALDYRRRDKLDFTGDRLTSEEGPSSLASCILRA
jgi:hypothetical protein